MLGENPVGDTNRHIKRDRKGNRGIMGLRYFLFSGHGSRAWGGGRIATLFGEFSRKIYRCRLRWWKVRNEGGGVVALFADLLCFFLLWKGGGRGHFHIYITLSYDF